MDAKAEVVVASGEELAAYLSAPTAPLPSGDVSVRLQSGKCLGIERKEWGNLVESYASGELVDQLRRMCRDYDTGVLVIEKPPRVAPNGQCYSGRSRFPVGVSFTSLMSDLALYQSELGVLVLFSPSTELTARLVSRLAALWDSGDTSALRRLRTPPKVDKRPERLMWIPGVGEVLAKRLLERYGTVEEVLKAVLSEGGVEGVEGFGPQKNKVLKEVLSARKVSKIQWWKAAGVRVHTR